MKNVEIMRKKYITIGWRRTGRSDAALRGQGLRPGPHPGVMPQQVKMKKIVKNILLLLFLNLIILTLGYFISIPFL